MPTFVRQQGKVFDCPNCPPNLTNQSRSAGNTITTDDTDYQTYNTSCLSRQPDRTTKFCLQDERSRGGIWRYLWSHRDVAAASSDMNAAGEQATTPVPRTVHSTAVWDRQAQRDLPQRTSGARDTPLIVVGLSLEVCEIRGRHLASVRRHAVPSADSLHTRNGTTIDQL